MPDRLPALARLEAWRSADGKEIGPHTKLERWIDIGGQKNVIVTLNEAEIVCGCVTTRQDQWKAKDETLEAAIHAALDEAERAL